MHIKSTNDMLKQEAQQEETRRDVQIPSVYNLSNSLERGRRPENVLGQC